MASLIITEKIIEQYTKLEKLMIKNMEKEEIFYRVFIKKIEIMQIAGNMIQQMVRPCNRCSGTGERIESNNKSNSKWNN